MRDDAKTDTSAPVLTERSFVDQSEPRRRPLMLWLVPVLLVVPIPALWWTWGNAHYPLRFDLLVVMTLFVGAVTIAVFAAVSGGFRRRIRWSLGMTAALVAFGFQWPAFTSAGALAGESTGIGFLGDLIPVVLAGSLIWLTARLAGDWYFAAGASVLPLLQS